MQDPVCARLAMGMMDGDFGFELLADSHQLTFKVATFTSASDLRPKSLSITPMASRSTNGLRWDFWGGICHFGDHRKAVVSVVFSGRVLVITVDRSVLRHTCSSPFAPGLQWA